MRGRRVLAAVLLCALLVAPCRASDPIWKDDLGAGIAAYEKLKPQEAVPLFETALSKAEAAGAKETDIAECCAWLGTVYHNRGRYKEAEPLLKRALAIREAKLGPDDLLIASSLTRLAILYDDQGRFGEAEPLYQKALRVGEAGAGSDSIVLTPILMNLSTLYRQQGRFGEALPLSERALAIRESKLGASHLSVAESLNNLALIYQRQGRLGDAEGAYKRALTIREAKLPADDLDIAQSLNNLGSLYDNLGRHSEAEAAFKRALAIREVKLGAGHSGVANCLSNLAECYQSQGRYGEAEPLMKRALAIREAQFGPDDRDVAISLNGLGKLYAEENRYAEAEPVYKRALAICEKSYGPGHPYVAVSLVNLAGLYREQGRYAEAEPLCKRALQASAKTLGTDHPEVATHLNNLAGLYDAQGRYAEAEPLFKRALAIREATLGADHPLVADCLNNLAACYDAQGRQAEVEALYKRALSIREARLSPTHPDVGASLNNLAGYYSHAGRYAEAELLYKQALGILEKTYGPDHLNCASALQNLAVLYETQGRYAEAEGLYKRAAIIQRGKRAAGWQFGTNAMRVQALQSRFGAASSILASLPVEGQVARMANKLLAGKGSEVDAEKVMDYLKQRTDSAHSLTLTDCAVLPSLALGVERKNPQFPLLATVSLCIERQAPDKLHLGCNHALMSSALEAMGTSGKSEAVKAYEAFKQYAPPARVSAASRVKHDLQCRVASDALLTLSYLLACRGEKDKSKECAIRAQSEELASGRTPTDKARRLLALADLYRLQSEYDEATEAVAISRRLASAQGKEAAHLEFEAGRLSAEIAYQKGDYDKCKNLSVVLVGVASKTGREDDAIVANELVCRSATRLYENAQQGGNATLEYLALGLRSGEAARAALSKRYGKQSARLAPVLVALSSLYRERGTRGDAARAQELLETVVAITEPVKNSNGASQQDELTADPVMLHVRGMAYIGLGEMALARAVAETDKSETAKQRELARDLFARAKQIHDGDPSPEGDLSSAIADSWLGVTYGLLGDRDLSYRNALTSAYVIDRYTRTAFAELTFPEQCAFLDRLDDMSARLIGTCSDSQLIPQIYPYLMRWKGLLVQSLSDQSELSRLASTRPDLKPALERLDALRQRKVDYLEQVASGKLKADSSEEARLENEYEVKKRQLANKAGLQLGDPMAKMELVDFQKYLADSECLVDIYTFTPIDGTSPTGIAHSHYGAFIVTKTDPLRFVDLGSCRNLHTGVTAWLSLLSRGGIQRALTQKDHRAHRRDIVSRSDSSSRSSSIKGELAARTVLQSAVWPKLMPALPPSVNRLYVCADGELARVPWLVLLPDDVGNRISLCEVDSPRELVQLDSRKDSNTGNKQVLLAGGILFSDPQIPYLKGTLQEIDSIAALAVSRGFAAKTLKERQAQKSRTKQELSKSLVAHLATHGFFEEFASAAVGVQGASSRALPRFSSSTAAAALMDRSPLSRSGIILATGPGDKSSRLTAEEIVDLDLSKCDLVTLSACDTGRGQQYTGQGVLGLRSAILAAGANAVLMSLWQVDDESTRVLMEEFYKRLWSGEPSMTKARALKEAQQAVRNRKPEWRHPYYWAAFTLAGKGW